jgi:hypothetical protein
MIELLSGALLFAYAIAGVHFLQFWRRTGDRLFSHFAIAFWLLALNELAISVPLFGDNPQGYVYLLRIFAFVTILVAIVDKNVARRKR